MKKKKDTYNKKGISKQDIFFFCERWGKQERENEKDKCLLQNYTKSYLYGILFTLIFAVKSFENAVPDEIYVRAGETVSYDFDVPVSVVLKQDSAEVFEYLTKDSPLTYCVNCRLFGIFPVKISRLCWWNRKRFMPVECRLEFMRNKRSTCDREWGSGEGR